MTVFGENPWLIWLCYAVAAMALVYAVQLQLSLRPGAKPVRGVPLWREDLPEPVVAAMQHVAPPARYSGFDAKSNRITTSLTEDDDAIFLHVLRTKGNNAPAPFNGTLKRSITGISLQVRISPLVPLVYLGLAIIVWVIMGGGTVAWVFAALVLALFLFTLQQSRSVLLDGLRIVKESNRVIEPVEEDVAT